MACRHPSLSVKLRRIQIPNYISTFLALIVVLCTACVTRVDARQTPENNQPPLGRILSRDGQGFPGSSDLYGIGIRAGYYCQLVATFFATTLTPENTRDLRTVNLLFQFTLFVGMVFQGSQPDSHAIECYLLILLLAGVTILQFSYPLICRSIEGSWKGLFKTLDCSVITLIMSVFMLMAFYTYSTWFWWVGMDNMLPEPSLTYAPDLTRTSVYNSPRTVGKALNVFALAYTCLFSIISIIRFGLSKPSFRVGNRNLFLSFIDSLFDKPKSFGREKNLDEENLREGNLREENPASDAESRLPRLDNIFWYMIGTILGFLGIINTIVGVESILKFNQVTNINQIYSAGQLIPFVAGVGTLVQVLKNIYVIKRKNWALRGTGKRFWVIFFNFLHGRRDRVHDPGSGGRLNSSTITPGKTATESTPPN